MKINLMLTPLTLFDSLKRLNAIRIIIHLKENLMISLKMLMLILATTGLAACSQSASTDLVWYEEAMQDDGSIVVVKKIESGYSVSRKEAGGNNYGYRLPKVEITDPKTGKPILWYPKNLPHLLPYALHMHEGVPYMFATFYLDGDYRAFGCPIPPYIVFRWEGDKWKRIPMTALPRQFKRHNLLAGAPNQIYNNQEWVYIKPGTIVRPEAIEMYVRGISSRAREGYPYDLYNSEIQNQDIGPYADCNGNKNRSTQYDNAEIK